MSIPTIMLFKDLNVLEKSVGFTPKEILTNWLKNHK
jgi:thioredoxin-like negative regulator of GroEL